MAEIVASSVMTVAAMPCRFEGHCAAQSRVSMMCHPCTVRWHLAQAASLADAWLQRETPNGERTDISD